MVISIPEEYRMNDIEERKPRVFLETYLIQKYNDTYNTDSRNPDRISASVFEDRIIVGFKDIKVLPTNTTLVDERLEGILKDYFKFTMTHDVVQCKYCDEYMVKLKEKESICPDCLKRKNQMIIDMKIREDILKEEK